MQPMPSSFSCKQAVSETKLVEGNVNGEGEGMPYIHIMTAIRFIPTDDWPYVQTQVNMQLPGMQQ